MGVDPDGERLCARTFELGEFILRELRTPNVGACFPHRVALLESCHGLRDLGLGQGTEAVGQSSKTMSVAEELLRNVADLELVRPERPDECCGFGGLFSVKLPEISGRMGRDRLRALAHTQAEYVTGNDMSCLLHLDGLQRRAGGGPRPIHFAEILAASPSA